MVLKAHTMNASQVKNSLSLCILHVDNGSCLNQQLQGEYITRELNLTF
jgi:hypothetical protein